MESFSLQMREVD